MIIILTVEDLVSLCLVLVAMDGLAVDSLLPHVGGKVISGAFCRSEHESLPTSAVLLHITKEVHKFSGLVMFLNHIHNLMDSMICGKFQ